MDVLVLIDKLDDLVHNAKPMPMTDKVRVDKEEIYDILDQMRATIPEEIKQARWIVKERQELLARLRQQPVDLALGLCEHLLPLLDDPARLLDLLRDRRPHLVEDVVDLFAVDPHLVGEGHGLRVVHEVVELVDQYEDVHTGESSDVAGRAV